MTKKKFNPEKMQKTVNNIFTVLDSITGNVRVRMGIEQTPMRQRLKQNNQAPHSVPQQQSSHEGPPPQQVTQPARQLGSRLRGLLPQRAQSQPTREEVQNAEMQRLEYERAIAEQEQSSRAREGVRKHEDRLRRQKSSPISL